MENNNTPSLKTREEEKTWEHLQKILEFETFYTLKELQLKEYIGMFLQIFSLSYRTDLPYTQLREITKDKSFTVLYHTLNKKRERLLTDRYARFTLQGKTKKLAKLRQIVKRPQFAYKQNELYFDIVVFNGYSPTSYYHIPNSTFLHFMEPERKESLKRLEKQLVSLGKELQAFGEVNP